MKIRLLAMLACLLLMTACTTDEAKLSPADLSVGLEVGNLAPEIEGMDLDDVPFKLSDYRGKVILLDFWGDW